MEATIVALKRFHAVMGEVAQHVPKNHMAMHLLQRSTWQGNPITYQNFYDESLNSTLKRAARFCHQLRFEGTLIRRMTYLLTHGGRGVKRPREL